MKHGLHRVAGTRLDSDGFPGSGILAIVGLAAVLAGCGGKRDGGAGQASGPVDPPRLVVLGFEGLDPEVLDDLASRGRTPNLSRLSRAPVSTTVPSDPRTAWASFATGAAPAAHGILGDVMRLPSTYELTRLTLAVGSDGKTRNLRTAEPFWVTASRAGVRVRVIRAPCSFPPDEVERGEVLSGSGTPDAEDGAGSYILVGAGGDGPPAPGGRFVRARPGVDGAWAVTLPGLEAGGTRLAAEITLRIERPEGGKPALIAASGRHEVAAEQGQWSDWLAISYEGGGRKVRAITRVLALALDPSPEALLSDPGVDPYAPIAPLSHPPYYSGFLADRYGLYRTAPSAVEERAFDAGLMPAAALLRQTYSGIEEQERITIGEMGRGGWDLLISIFDEPGPALRIFSRVSDPASPAFDRDLESAYGDTVEKVYARLDAFVGEVMKGMRASDRLLVVGERGLRSVRREFNPAAWLVKAGHLKLVRGARAGGREGLADVDWASTRAYAAGAGGLYLNLRGREPGGTVEPGAEADALLESIRAALASLGDGGRPVVGEILAGEEAFRGPAADRAPDLLVVLEPGYGIGPAGQLGAVPARILADSSDAWIPGADGGDPADAHGVVLSTVAVRPDGSILDVAPTVLGFFGLKPTPVCTGRDLW